jgi:hypothetical protein
MNRYLLITTVGFKINDPDWIGKREKGCRRRSGRRTAPTAVSAAAPSPEKTKTRFTALSRKRKTPGWGGEQCELTKVRTEDEIGLKKMRCLEWRSVVLAVARLEGYGSPKGME